jgi:hypothetical protein
VAALNFIQKVYFGPLFFSFSKWLVPLVFRNLILVPKLISFIFTFFFVRGERGGCLIHAKREKVIVDDNYSHQNG